MAYPAPPRPPACGRCRSSVVEHSLGKGEVDSSILSGSTSHRTYKNIAGARLYAPRQHLVSLVSECRPSSWLAPDLCRPRCAPKPPARASRPHVPTWRRCNPPLERWRRPQSAKCISWLSSFCCLAEPTERRRGGL